ncbi:hypothetical protein [Lelliottia amnigena]
MAEKAGFEKIFDNVSLSHANVNDISSLNSYASKGFKIISLISAGMLSDFPGDSSSKNHWIVWTSQVKNANGNVVSNSTSGTDKVELTLFSWGDVGNQLKNNINLNSFVKHTFGGLVFRSIK